MRISLQRSAATSAKASISIIEQPFQCKTRIRNESESNECKRDAKYEHALETADER